MNRYRSLITGLLLVILFFIVISRFDSTGDNSHEIPISNFLRYVDEGKVEKIVIRGNKIEGRLEDETAFFTYTYPDPKLVERLSKTNLIIEVEEKESTNQFLTLLIQFSPLLFLIGFWLFFMKKMPGPGKFMSIGKSKAQKVSEKQIKISFKDVAGVDEGKEDLQEIVDFLTDPTKFQRLGGKIPRGVLMIGEPGTGKTLLAKAVAGEAGVPFFSISGSDFVEMFVGVGASRVRDLFEEGRKNAPCIIFIDEIDAVGRHRGAGLGGGHDEREQTLNQLLVEMDGFDTSDGVIVIAATNRMDILDPALLRPGRFDRQVHVPLPDIKGREEILKVHVKKIKIAEEVDLKLIGRATPGFSGAELENVINEAALWAARNNKTQVTLGDLEWARDKVMMGVERKSMIITKEELKNTAYHEAGHALVAAYSKHSDPVHKITIIPRGRALGLTAYLPEEDQYSYEKSYLKDKIAISMGGRAAEELVFSERTTGAEGDLKQATQIAYNMVCKWGMSDKLGALTVQGSESSGFLAMDYHQDEIVSEETQEIVDKEVKTILKSAHKKALQILTDHIEKLHQLAKMLLDIETVNNEQFLELINRNSTLKTV